VVAAAEVVALLAAVAVALPAVAAGADATAEHLDAVQPGVQGASVLAKNKVLEPAAQEQLASRSSGL
jgi:hypothetical protein